jgi:hypothetical protein
VGVLVSVMKKEMELVMVVSRRWLAAKWREDAVLESAPKQ